MTTNFFRRHNIRQRPVCQECGGRIRGHHHSEGQRHQAAVERAAKLAAKAELKVCQDGTI